MQKEIKKNELSGREIIIILFLGIMTMLIVFIFIKRQIIRFTLKSRRGPHYPIGTNAPKFLKREIDRRLHLTKEIKMEPLLISGDNQFHEFQTTDEVPTEHYYRMKAIDELKKLEELVQNIGGNDVKRKPNHDLRDYLIGLTKNNQILNKCDLKLINQFVDLYSHARHEPNPVFGKRLFNEYMSLNQKIQKFIATKFSIQTNSQAHSQVKFDRKLLNNQTQLIGTNKSVLGGDTKETCV